jgi:uncharacterized protein YcbX
MIPNQHGPAANRTASISAVTGLYYYPVKSCGGTALEWAEIGPRGILRDREFMVVEAATSEFVTQRELPRLALIRPSLVDDELRLVAPGMPDLAVGVVKEGCTHQTTVWRDTCAAVDQGDEVAAWLSDYLSAECRLVRMADDVVRKVDPSYAVSDRDNVGFADGYPLLLTSEESLADLNARLAAPLPMNRFRPNVVIAGSGVAFAEDQFRTIRVGEVVFHAVKRCARCVTTTVDQATAERGTEPLRTLATYRNIGHGVLFGQNLIHEGTGVIRRGDRVEVIA